MKYCPVRLNHVLLALLLVVQYPAGVTRASAAEPPRTEAVQPAEMLPGKTGLVPARQQAAWRDLDARILVESKVFGADGVLRTTRFEDLVMRRGNEVWSRRMLVPAGPSKPLQHAAHKHEAGAGGHKHFNPLEAGRVVGLEGARASLRFVLEEDRTVVSVPSQEFSNVGFDGSWERAYFMVAAGELARMTPSRRPSTVPGAIWYEREQAGRFERVLWDSSQMIARVIESGTVAGDKWHRVTVGVSSQPAPSPAWRQPRGFEEKRYSDYLD